MATVSFPYFEFDCNDLADDKRRTDLEELEITDEFPDLRTQVWPFLLSQGSAIDDILFFYRKQSKLGQTVSRFLRHDRIEGSHLKSLGSPALVNQTQFEELWVHQTLEVFVESSSGELLREFVSMFPRAFGRRRVYDSVTKPLPLGGTEDELVFASKLRSLDRQQYLLSFWDEGLCCTVFGQELVMDQIDVLRS